VRFDYQSEHWDLEEKPKILLFPDALSIGIVWRGGFPTTNPAGTVAGRQTFMVLGSKGEGQFF
jgi:hypothetical protein